MDNFEQDLLAAANAVVDKSNIPGFAKWLAKWAIAKILPDLYDELDKVAKSYGPRPQDGGGPGPVPPHTGK